VAFGSVSLGVGRFASADVRYARMIRQTATDMFESDDGFTVQTLGRTGLLYREGDRVMRVGSEVNAPGHGMSIWPSTIRAWREPYELEIIDDAKRAEIVDNIAAVIAWVGEPLAVVDEECTTIRYPPGKNTRDSSGG